VQAIRNLLAFLRDYRAAWHAWRHGNREQLFPAGTYALRIYARVACAPARLPVRLSLATSGGNGAVSATRVGTRRAPGRRFVFVQRRGALRAF